MTGRRRTRVGSHRAAAWLAVRILLIALAVHLLLPQLAGLEASGLLSAVVLALLLLAGVALALLAGEGGVRAT